MLFSRSPQSGSSPVTPSRRRWFVGAYFLLLLLLGLVLHKDYGVAWDEPLDHLNGMVSTKYAGGRFFPNWIREQDSFKDVPDLYSFDDNDHGAILEMTLAIVKLNLGVTELHDYYMLRHLGIFLLFMFGCWALYNIGRIRFSDWRIGLAVVTLLLLSPRLFAESFYNVKDIGFLVLFTVGIYTLVRLLQRPTLGRALVHAVATAVAIDLRILGILLIGLTFGMLVLEALFGREERATWRKLLLLFGVYLVATALVTVVGWPYLWDNPIGNFVHAYNNLKHYRWSGEVLYMGQIMPAPELPWHYATVWILITTPVTYTLALVIGTLIAIVALVQRRFAGLWSFERRLDILFMGWFFLPVLMIIFLDSVIYDGWRHLYFIYPGFLLLAVRGIVAVAQAGQRNVWLKGVALVLGLVFGAEVVYTLVRMVRSHPQQQVYFSFLPPATTEQLFERDYWGLSYRQGLEWLLKNEPNTPIRIYAPNTLLLDNNLGILKPEQRARFTVTPSNKNRYFLGSFRTQNQPYADSLGWRVYQVESSGVMILDVRHHD
ncbi:ArnT family glycosyltransferase [Hymenobacter chitinivorans]|uniref:Dolichyl-phosphate-mannose-protein mannosyltransferase n=1 Tax=Hymenobacter chitinivorans DSM 11115 TaxID=1121954 RepID=A0A2M9AQP6_9BACT|nr:hypothetical protein [Hymenobacter chitinivorans]PJJ48024.1 hypothetical protein CLV45_4715 [Hymenobacter chitinivorans DSM 11115]